MIFSIFHLIVYAYFLIIQFIYIMFSIYIIFFKNNFYGLFDQVYILYNIFFNKTTIFYIFNIIF